MLNQAIFHKKLDIYQEKYQFLNKVYLSDKLNSIAYKIR